jgi:hypothetical protein
MQRLVEQPADDGIVFRGSERVGRVHYHLAVYQHFSEGEGDRSSGSGVLEVEGRIVPVDPVDVSKLPVHETEYTLHLADGRQLDFTIASAEGKIRSTGRGLYEGRTSTLNDRTSP